MIGIKSAVVGLVAVVAVAGMSNPAAAADDGPDPRGAAVGWGYNNVGQLGDNSTDNSSVPVAVNTSGALAGKTITAISTGNAHSCAIADGAAYCWGNNGNGQLGNNSTTDSSVPVAVKTSGALAGKTITAISTGNAHSCAIADGAAFCWGNNGNGQLGDNSTTDSSVPVAVDTSGVLAGTTVTAISTGGDHSCAVADGAAYCWGNNFYGQLGDNSTDDSAVPVAVSTSGVLAGATVTAISTGDFHSCAVADGAAYCWGNNLFGQLGNDSNTFLYSVPVAVTTSGVLAGTTVTAISTGGDHSCAVADSKAYCWGNNFFGQLGNNSTDSSSVPVAVTTSGVLAGTTVTAISTGGAHSCAVADGAAYCWGYNLIGQLGNNSTADSSVPVAVDSTGVLAGTTITAISAGSYSTLALTVAPAVSIGGGPVDFGDQRVSTTSTSRTLTITNTGGADLTISSVTLAGADPGQFAIDTNTCTTVVAVNSTCQVDVTFTPTSTGAKTASLTLTSDAPGSPDTVTLTGTGVVPAVSTSPANLDFAEQTVGQTTAPKTVTITTTGTADLTITTVAMAGTDPGQFSIDTNTCTTTVAVNGTCQVAVTFTPTSTGAKTATVQITSNAASSPDTVTLTGTGVVPAVSTSPAGLDFGDIRIGQTSAPKTVTVTNTGKATLRITDVRTTGAGFTTTADTCTTATVAPSATCTVTVTFMPTATGLVTGSLTLTSNAPGSPHTVTLTATGTPVPTPVTGTKKQTLRPNLPKRIKRSGLTVITPANATTNAGQPVRTIIRGGPLQSAAAGEVRTFTIVRGSNGKTSVRTFGNPNLRITVTQRAPAVKGYQAFTRKGTYVRGNLR